MMRLIWTKRAQNERFKVAAYISVNFGKKATEEFVSDLTEKWHWIKEMPTIGRFEPLLADRIIQYRYLHVGKHNSNPDDDEYLTYFDADDLKEFPEF